MFRYTLSKALSSGTSGRCVMFTRAAAGSAGAPAKAPEKIEVFVDDQSVWVEPGTTVLQVSPHLVTDRNYAIKSDTSNGIVVVIFVRTE